MYSRILIIFPDNKKKKKNYMYNGAYNMRNNNKKVNPRHNRPPIFLPREFCTWDYAPKMGSSARRYPFINRSFITPVKHLLDIYMYIMHTGRSKVRVTKHKWKLRKYVFDVVSIIFVTQYSDDPVYTYAQTHITYTSRRTD